MKFIFSRLFLIFVAIFFATTLNAKEGKVIGSSNHEVPSWFKDSFLDISEDIEEATEKNKHFMIFLDFEGCPYCSKMLKESFEEDNKTSQFIKNNFDVIELNVKGSRELTWVDGDVLTEKDLTEKLKIQYSPTLLIFNSNKEIVARVNGYRNSKDFQYILDFIQTKSYEKMDFTSYLSKLDKKDTYAFIPNKMFKDLNDLSKIKTLDQKEYEEEVLFHQDIAKNNKVGGYQILFWKVLPYKAPIATQSAIVLPYDMEGNILNEIYNFDESVRMQYMHIAVFPLEDESVVLAFYHKRDKLYRQLRHQINSSSQEKVLQYINYLIFEHTENVYFSKKIEEEIKNNKMIEKLSQEANGLPRFGHLSADNMFGIGYDAVKPEDIPNFLDESWAIKEEESTDGEE